MGAVDFDVINTAVSEEQQPSKTTYIKWKDTDRYGVGKYSSEYGPATAVRRFKSKFPKLNESTARYFKKRYEDSLNERNENETTPSKALTKYKTKTGTPLLLGVLDAMVQKYLWAASNRGAVISRTSAVSAAKALLQKYSNIAGKIDLESSSWAKNFFIRMGYVQRRNTSSKVEIPEKAQKEIEYQFHYDIISKVEKYNIPDLLTMNLDQTPSYLVPCKKFTMAKKGSNNVTMHGCNDKRTITGTFVITLSGEFLSMQLIYGSKTLQSLPRYQFPQSFSLSVNPMLYSNTTESLKLLNEIIIPYVKKIRSSEDIPNDQYSLVIMDVFTGQKTSEVLDLLDANKMQVTNVPPNMTKYYQPLDLTVNGYAKKFMSRKFSGWYTQQISLQVEKGVPIDEIDVKLRLSLIKPLHAEWMTHFYNQMTTPESKQVIKSGWLAAGIRDAIRLGLSNLPSIDPFEEIAPMKDVAAYTVPVPDSAFAMSTTEKSIGYSRQHDSDDDDEEEYWENPDFEDRGAFNIFDEFDDEAEL